MDGNDFLAVYAATAWAAERARSGFGPTVIEHFTYRAEGHSTSDDPTKYRPAAEAAAWPLGDPIERLKGLLVKLGLWSDDDHALLEAELQAEVRSAGREAEALGKLGNTGLSAATMFDDVFKVMPPHLLAQRAQAGF